MIISCISCNKHFEIDSNLIPDKGRLLVCGSCNHQWFFSKKITNEQTTTNINDEEKSDTNNFTEDSLEKDTKINKIIDKFEEESIKIPDITNDKKVSKKKKPNIKLLNLILVFIIFFIAVIIVADTFKYPMSKYIPNIEFILYNLYETIKDIILFFKNLF